MCCNNPDSGNWFMKHLQPCRYCLARQIYSNEDFSVCMVAMMFPISGRTLQRMQNNCEGLSIRHAPGYCISALRCPS